MNSFEISLVIIFKYTNTTLFQSRIIAAFILIFTNWYEKIIEILLKKKVL